MAIPFVYPSREMCFLWELEGLFFFFIFLDKSNTDESCGFGHHIFFGGGGAIPWPMDFPEPGTRYQSKF